MLQLRVRRLQHQTLSLGSTERRLDNIMEELLKPIYRQHPDLIPPELDREFLWF